MRIGKQFRLVDLPPCLQKCLILTFPTIIIPYMKGSHFDLLKTSKEAWWCHRKYSFRKLFTGIFQGDKDTLKCVYWFRNRILWKWPRLMTMLSNYIFWNSESSLNERLLALRANNLNHVKIAATSLNV
jgi:hypothetical protein